MSSPAGPCRAHRVLGYISGSRGGRRRHRPGPEEPRPGHGGHACRSRAAIRPASSRKSGGSEYTRGRRACKLMERWTGGSEGKEDGRAMRDRHRPGSSSPPDAWFTTLRYSGTTSPLVPLSRLVAAATVPSASRSAVAASTCDASLEPGDSSSRTPPTAPPPLLRLHSSQTQRVAAGSRTNATLVPGLGS